MKIGVLGTGDVGKALGKAFIALGHEVRLGGRETTNDKAQAWVKETGPKASYGTFSDAASFGEMIVLATLGVANEGVLRSAGPNNLHGKILIDATNPLDFSQGFPPKLAVGNHDSGGELVQRMAPDAKVVKAFNTVGNSHMFKPDFQGGPPDMFIAGNDDKAKEKVAALLKEFGWGVIDIGTIEGSRYLEGMCMIWVLSAVKSGKWDQAFKLLKK